MKTSKRLATASRSHVSIRATKFCTKYAASSPVGVIDSAKISPTLIATPNLVAVRGHVESPKNLGANVPTLSGHQP